MKITLVIPAFNESESVPHTANALRPTLEVLRKKYDEVELIFVDDGSKDNTREMLRDEFADDPSVMIVAHDGNKGLGAAVRTGWSKATGDIVVTTDFDGTYAFDTIPALLETMGDADMVTASPYHPKGEVEGLPKYRLMFSFGASLLYRLLVRWNIYTWTALYRAYRSDVVKNVTWDSNDFLSMAQIMVNTLRAGYTVVEFPAVLRVRRFGQSSIKIARVTKSHLKYQARLVAEALGLRRITRLVTAPAKNASVRQ